MRKTMLYITIGIILLLAAAAVAMKYMDGLASGWGNARSPYDGSFAVHSYEELAADENHIQYLERFLPTRLESWYGMEAVVRFDTVTKDETQITVTVTNVRVPEDATRDHFDPEWHRKNVENRLDDTSVQRKDQSWSLTLRQKECIVFGIKDVVTYITDDNVMIIDEILAASLLQEPSFEGAPSR